ncbi:MAG: 23S rRNA (adenine(2503)-C(2))-methyltransferase RlmN [Actinobacteria bacterium]|nr:23S rRNA (adenine(2503)-C(2))-methyltransferase RlmN [Actinomycetota bacterium]
MGDTGTFQVSKVDNRYILDLDKLKVILAQSGEPPYRFKQIFSAMYKDLKESFLDITELPRDLRDQLTAELPITTVREVKLVRSSDESAVKAVFSLEDSNRIEAVLMRFKDGRNSVCVSSQVGCALGCLFCQTGQLGFTRNLSTYEILDQVLYFTLMLVKENEKATNVVFMGMGEPFFNFENVMSAIDLLNSKDGMYFGARRISISTSGIVPGIEKFTELNSQVNLAISLNATTDEKRDRIMPVNRTYNLESLFNSCYRYIKKTHRKLFFEYVLIKGINDSDEDAVQLALMIGENPLYHVNLIRYNRTFCGYEPSDLSRVQYFGNVLRKRRVNVTVRESPGSDIFAACGQLGAALQH